MSAEHIIAEKTTASLTLIKLFHAELLVALNGAC
jgi:hypothetical protein